MRKWKHEAEGGNAVPLSATEQAVLPRSAQASRKHPWCSYSAMYRKWGKVKPSGVGHPISRACCGGSDATGSTVQDSAAVIKARMFEEIARVPYSWREPLLHRHEH